MAANPRLVPAQTEPLAPIPAGDPPPSLARAYLVRLSQLHDEAATTAHLANLLGRAPYAVSALATATILTTAMVATGAPGAQLAMWFVLVFVGLGAAINAYAKAIRSPFELAVLQGFARDFAATLVYAGFAWGAGAMLVLPPGASLIALLLFGAGVPALVAGCLGVRDMALCFLVPAVSLAAFAALLRPIGGGLVDMAALLVAGAAVAAAVQIADRLASRPNSPDLAGISAA